MSAHAHAQTNTDSQASGTADPPFTDFSNLRALGRALEASCGIPVNRLTRQEVESLLAVERWKPQGAPDRRGLMTMNWYSGIKYAKTAGGAPALPYSLVALTGQPKAGKDTIADHFISKYRNVGKVAFSDAIIAEVNGLLRSLGWSVVITPDNKSDPAIRKVLQDWGIIRRRTDGQNYWVERAIAAAHQLVVAGTDLVFLTGARTPEDVRALADANAAVWHVIRTLNGYSADHEIERQLENVPVSAWDAVIYNHEGAMVKLFEDADQAIKQPPRRQYLAHLPPQ